MLISKKELYDLYIIKNLGSKEIAKIKNIGKTTVLNYLKRYNIPKKSTGAQIKYIANDSFFDKWSVDLAYCLGFIASDGHVWKKRPYITIGIHKKDIAILEYIRDKISPHSKIRISKDKCQICIFSKHIHKKLTKIGIDHQKTFNLKLPNIPKKYISHFIRGFFDGDGSIWKTNFYSGGKDYYYANIISASKQILEDISIYLDFGSLNKVKNKYYELKFCQSDCIKLSNIIYKDAPFKLERKYNKFLQINSQYKLWTKEEDDIILKQINDRNTKYLVSMLPDRNLSTIQTRKNYLRKKIYDSQKNCRN